MQRLLLLLPVLTTQAVFVLHTSAQSSQSLVAAVKENNIKEVRSLLEKGANPDSYDDDSDNLLMNAALYASVDLMQLLLEKGSHPNAVNKLGETALMWSVHDLAKIKLLLDHGADVNAVAASGNTPLLIAAVGSDQYNVVKLLLDHGADPLTVNKKKENALIRAALFGDTLTISLLLNKGIPINAGDKDTTTALINSIFNVNRLVTIQLLERGADPDMIGAFGLTALAGAVTYNDLESVQAILNKCKKINTLDNDGNSALMWAAYNEHDNVAIIQALLERGADVNIRGRDGSTALSWALKKGNTATVALLKKAGAK